MILYSLKTCAIVLLAACLTACRQQPADKVAEPAGNAVYYWRTTFELDDAETAFLQCHNIDRIYLRMFDVAVERNDNTNKMEAVPIATTVFNSDIPDNIQIVPTVYITLEALNAINGDEEKYAELIIERLRAMMSYNGCGPLREIQFDCDWTSRTRTTYVALCRAARKMLQHDKIALSSTIRLHQLSEDAPPVDCGVLMLYNTGALKNPDTRNSILDIKNVRLYLRKRRKCNIPLDYAYPAFGWGVKFHDGKFCGIVRHPENEVLKDGDTIRLERPTADEVFEVKALVEKELGAPSRYNIIYHLDNKQLKHYTYDEISKIYAAN